MTLTEFHMVAEISGSIFLAVSAVIIIFELHQNLKQRKKYETLRTKSIFTKIWRRISCGLLKTKG